MKLKVNLQNASDEANLPDRAHFRRWVKAALTTANETHQALEITIRLVNKKESAELNLHYRHKKGPTNVLSFPFGDFCEKEIFYLGDLAICAAVVAEEANRQNKKVLAHWAHLTLHGVLHLLGYDHEVEEEAAIMEALEVKILRTLGFENPYV